MTKIITLEDMNKDLFYKMPKAFFHNPKYMFMKNETKMAYSLIRDILSLSIKNGWVNDKNEPFVRITREKLMLRLQVKGKEKMAAIMKELVDNELIVEKRLGQGNSNIIYVCIPEELQNVIYDDEELLKAITENELSNIGISEKFENRNSAQTVDSQQKFENRNSKSSTIERLKVIISKSKKEQNRTVIETNVSDTNSSETKPSENESLVIDNDDIKRIKEEWSLYHNKDIHQSILNLLTTLLSRYDIEMVSLLIDLSTSSTSNELLYIKGIVRRWRENNINNIDDYFNHEQNRI